MEARALADGAAVGHGRRAQVVARQVEHPGGEVHGLVGAHLVAHELDDGLAVARHGEMRIAEGDGAVLHDAVGIDAAAAARLRGLGTALGHALREIDGDGNALALVQRLLDGGMGGQDIAGMGGGHPEGGREQQAVGAVGQQSDHGGEPFDAGGWKQQRAHGRQPSRP